MSRRVFLGYLACFWSVLYVVGALLVMQAKQVQAATMQIENIPVGKVISVHGQKFVKIGSDGVKGSRFLALEQISWGKTYVYTGSVQTLKAPYAGTYRIELWGANSGWGYNSYGGYVAGDINLTAGETLYVYSGGAGVHCSQGANAGSYNGGGQAESNNEDCGIGGGASDVRLVGGMWNEASSLRSRIMVAGGSGGGGPWYGGGGAGGGLTGGSGNGIWRVSNGYSDGNGSGGTQTMGGVGGNISTSGGDDGSFGVGGAGENSSGGGGYYGGGGGSLDASGGGSSYISGHTGSVAIISAANQAPKAGCVTGTSDVNCSTHYSGKTFTRTVMIDGDGYAWLNAKGSQVQMPNPVGGSYALGTGHTGNGVAKITLIARNDQCPFGCASCSNATTCEICSAGYLKSGGSCVLASTVVAGCSASDGVACTACAAGRYLSSGSCPTCPTGCATCTSASMCQTCSSGYLKSGDTCAAASSVVPNCTNSNGSACTACATGYALSGGACVPTGSVANCTTYSAPEVCSACSSGRKLMNGKCELDCTDAANIAGTMQSFTIAQCSAYATPTATNYTEIGCLTDTRDGKAYEVRKFADGKCWMVDNLMYGGTTDDCAGVDAAGYTNATYGGTNGMATPSNRFGAGTYGNCRDPRVGGAAPCTANSTVCGYYYNWQATMQHASAYYYNTYTGPINNVQGICPAGWHLPSGGSTTSTSEFATLDIANGGAGVSTLTVNAASNFWRPGYGYKGVYSGYAINSSLSYQGSHMFQWSSSESLNVVLAWLLYVNGGAVNPMYSSYKYLGLTVRCVKDTTCTANCTSCSGASCTACASGYTLSGGACVMECNVNGCISCSSPNYCSLCDEDNYYYESGGECHFADG